MSQIKIQLHFHYGYMHTAEFLDNGSSFRGPSHMLALMRVYDRLNIFNQSINQSINQSMGMTNHLQKMNAILEDKQRWASKSVLIQV